MKIFKEKKSKSNNKIDGILKQINISKSELNTIQEQGKGLEKDNLDKANSLKLLVFEINKRKEEIVLLENKKKNIDRDISECSKTLETALKRNVNLSREQNEVSDKTRKLEKEYVNKNNSLVDKYETFKEDFDKTLDLIKKDIEEKKEEIEKLNLNKELSEKELKDNEANISVLLKNVKELKESIEILSREKTNFFLKNTKLLEDIEELELKKKSKLSQLSLLEITLEDKEKYIIEKEKEVQLLQNKAIRYIERERKLEEASKKIIEYYKKAGVSIKI